MRTKPNTGDKKYEERILHLRRVSKKTSGGNYISFSALVAIGDGNGNVGLGMGRGLEVPPAIQKAISQAKKHMIQLPIFNDTIPHHIELKFKASRLLLKPAPPGTGLKVGGVVRVILDLAGVNDASGKIIGSRNQVTNAYAVMEAIKKLKPRIVAEPKTVEKTIEVKEEVKVEEQKKEVETETVKKVEVVAKEEAPKAKKEPKSVKKTEVAKTEKKPVKKVAAKKS